MDKSTRFSELDAFRGLAALGVVIFHYGTAYAFYYKDRLVYPLILFGQYAVPLFFMISGFVILMTMERTKSGQDFIVGRVSRLYPAYWASLLIHLLLALVVFRQFDFTLPTVLWNFTMLQKFFQVPNLVIIYWTLAIEISFYLVMLILFKLNLLKQIDAVSAGWLALLALNLVVANHAAPDSQSFNGSEGFYLATNSPRLLAMAPSLHPLALITFLKDFIKTNFILLSGYAQFCIAGITLYRAKQFGFSFYRWLILAACVVIQWFDYGDKGIVVKIFPQESWGLTLVFILLICLFYLAIQGRLTFLTWKPLLYLGTVSYALYLTHIDIGLLLLPVLKHYGVNPNLGILMTTCLAIAVASLITFRVEKPALEWIRTHYKKRAA